MVGPLFLDKSKGPGFMQKLTWYGYDTWRGTGKFREGELREEDGEVSSPHVRRWWKCWVLWEREEKPSGISEWRNDVICLKTGSLFTAGSRKIICSGPGPNVGSEARPGAMEEMVRLCVFGRRPNRVCWLIPCVMGAKRGAQVVTKSLVWNWKPSH